MMNIRHVEQTISLNWPKQINAEEKSSTAFVNEIGQLEFVNDSVLELA